MTFLHKLANRLARLKAAFAIGLVVALACERIAQTTDPSGSASRLDLSPKSLTLMTNQTTKFTVVALTSTGDTTSAAVFGYCEKSIVIQGEEPEAVDTVIAAVPPFVSIVAVKIAEPAATPETNPLPLTVATPALSLAQLTARPVRGAPVESSGVAVNCVVCPTETLAVEGVTTTEATGTAVTVTVAESDAPPPVARACTLYWPVWPGALYFP